MFTLVLDRAYRPAFVWEARKAFQVVFAGRASVVMNRSAVFRTVRHTFPVPLVISVNALVHGVKRTPSRYDIFVRDGFTCAYCGCIVRDSEATIDHILPKSRGGEWSWENLVTACCDCNQRKGGRTPEEAGMKLLILPTKPLAVEVALRKALIRGADEEFIEALRMFAGEKFVVGVLG